MNDRGVPGNPHWRLLGGALMLLCMLNYRPGAENLLQQLILPLGMAVGTALIVRNLLAVLVTAALLAFIQTRWNSLFATGSTNTEWIANSAYPLLGIGCTLWAGQILWARFRSYMRATASARNAHRQTTQVPEDD